jgi:hypothetical protein
MGADFAKHSTLAESTLLGEAPENFSDQDRLPLNDPGYGKRKVREMFNR